MDSFVFKICCPTWQHLKAFCEEKLKEGNILLARVPFSPELHSEILVALQIPNGDVVEIAAEVKGVRSAPQGSLSAVQMCLHGLTSQLRLRLGRIIEEGEQPGPQLPTVAKSVTETGIPVPVPCDCPIDELVEVTELPRVEDVPKAAQEQYRALERIYRALREKAAHDVLGVAWDADIHTVRSAYFLLVKMYHPDVLARHNSWEISYLASEMFIYINKAYDVLRDSAVAFGGGTRRSTAGDWVANFEDIGDPEQAATPRAVSPQSQPFQVRFYTPNPDAIGTDDDILGWRSAGFEHYRATRFSEAKRLFMQILQEQPRDREARALYHVAYGQELLLGAGQKMWQEAMTQFEVALQHDMSCELAQEAKQQLLQKRLLSEKQRTEKVKKWLRR